MGFIDCIKGFFDESEFPREPNFRAVMFGDGAIFIENVKNICIYTKEELLFALKKGCIRIIGEGLYVKKYCEGDVVICGKIKGIEIK